MAASGVGAESRCEMNFLASNVAEEMAQVLS